MILFRKCREFWGKLHRLSRLVVKLSFCLMLVVYIIALAAQILAPHASDYLYALSVYHGCLEAAPALFVAGFCAAVVGDLMLKSRNPENEPKDGE